MSKTDRNDAQHWPQFLSKGLLPTSAGEGRLHAQVGSLANTRDKLVKLRTSMLNKVHAPERPTGARGRREAYDHPRNLQKILREEWPAAVGGVGSVATPDQDLTAERIAKLEREICELGKRLEGRDC